MMKNSACGTQENPKDTDLLLHAPLVKNDVNMDHSIDEGSEDYYSEGEFESETFEEMGGSEVEKSIHRCSSSTYSTDFPKEGEEVGDEKLCVTVQMPSQVVALRKLLHSIVLIVPHDKQQQQLHHPTKIVESQRKAMEHALTALEAELLEIRLKAETSAKQQLVRVRQKRRRADLRRARHVRELAKARQEAESAYAREEVCHSQIKALKHRVTDAEVMVDNLKDTISAAQNTSELRLVELREAKIESMSLRAAVEEMEQRLKDMETALEHELELSTQIQKHHLEMDAIKANIERKERVLESETAALPSRHQAVLDSELERIKLWEDRLEVETADLKWRETSLKEEMKKTSEASQESIRNAHRICADQVDTMKQTIANERHLLQVEVSQAVERAANAEAKAEAERKFTEISRIELEEAFTRLASEKSALSIRSDALVPKFREVERANKQAEFRIQEARIAEMKVVDTLRSIEAAEAIIHMKEVQMDREWQKMRQYLKSGSVELMEQIVSEAADSSRERQQQPPIRLAQTTTVYKQLMKMVAQLDKAHKAFALDGNLNGLPDSDKNRQFLVEETEELDGTEVGLNSTVCRSQTTHLIEGCTSSNNDKDLLPLSGQQEPLDKTLNGLDGRVHLHGVIAPQSDIDSSTRIQGIRGVLPSYSKLSHDIYGNNNEGYRESFLAAERNALLTLSQVRTILQESKFSQHLEADDLHGSNIALGGWQ